MGRIDEGDINLAPRYQRQYVWREEKAHRLVESVLCGLFVPAVVLHAVKIRRTSNVCRSWAAPCWYCSHLSSWR